MKYVRWSFGALVGLSALLGAIIFGVPTYLASGSPITVDQPNFSSEEGWLIRPEHRPGAVWEDGWAIDVFVVPSTIDTLNRHGIVLVSQGARSADGTAIDAEILELLERVGPVYAPNLRVPTQASPTPNWDAAKQDLALALEHYSRDDNRGRALAIFFPSDPNDLSLELESLFMQAGAENMLDRVVLILSPEPLNAELGTIGAFPNASVHQVQLEKGPRSWRQFMAMPNIAPRYRLPNDTEDLTDRLDEAVAEALLRAETNARKAVEPFGAIEIVREAPVNRPCEAGLRCNRD